MTITLNDYFLYRLFGHPFDMHVFVRWLTVNIGLAIIPVILGYLFLRVVEERAALTPAARGLLATLLFVAWLAFVPNTCYLLTEWRHFLDNVAGGTGGRVTLRVSAEALFYFVYSGIGVLCFALAIRPVERALRLLRAPFALLAFPLFLLLSLGVYLGLVLRLNSWDIVTRPGRVWAAILHIGQSHEVITAILVFALLLWGLYEGLDIWVDGVKQRLGWLQRPAGGAPGNGRGGGQGSRGHGGAARRGSSRRSGGAGKRGG